VPDCEAAARLKDFTIQAYIWPTTPTRGRQGIVTKWCAQEKSGFALILDEHGHVALQVGDGTGRVDCFSTGRTLQRRRWYRVGAAFDAAARRIRVFQQALSPVPDIEESGSIEVRGIPTLPKINRAPLVFAALGADEPRQFQEHFNGKIDSPRIASRALDEAESAEFAGPDFLRLDSDLLGAWDFSLLLPTTSYMAYANDHFGTDGADNELLNNILTVLSPHDLFLNEHWEYGGSLYDVHSDGSGVCHASRLRPMLNMRPKRQNVLAGFGHSRLWQFPADTHITDWLEALDYGYDVITDEEMHARGYDLLSPYRVVLTGTHPEYYSSEMWDAISRYRDRGGRVMYLGADGFYWRVAYHHELPGVIELRRAESGVRAWPALPGEYHHSFDGRQGGLWARQGRSPHSLVGIGFAAQGFDVSTYYVRLPDSLKPEMEFIFEGVDRTERIGDFGLIAGGAAGLELDRADLELGTPLNTYILARSEGHTDTYVLVPEEFLETSLGLGGHENAKVRADMVFFRAHNGGAVFSVGSIAWAGSLSHDSYRNNVSRITQNVLERFLDARPF